MPELEYIKHIENLIKEIESINFENNWSYEQVIHSILKIPKLPIILFKKPKGDLIFRSRINKGIDLFEHVSEISIPKECYVTNYARANKPGQSLFYGSENRPTSYLEFALHLAEITPFGKEVLITVGVWELKRDLTLVLVFDPSLPRNNVFNKYHGEGLDEFLTKTPEKFKKGTIRFFEFISKKYAKQVSNNYHNFFITCAYSNIVFAYEQCDGIIYPSVPRGGDAFNVVLKKNVVSEEVLELKAVRTDKFIALEQPNGKHDFVNTASIDASKIKNDNIEWNSNWQ